MKNRIADFEVEYEHAGDLGLPRVVLGPRSYIADRIVPDFEVSIIPARKRETATAVMKARIQPTATQSFQGKKQKLLNIVKSATRTPDNAFAFDLRPYNLGNWSSAMNMCFPIACQVVAETNARDMPEPIFITNENWNPKLKSFFEAMGLKILETNSVVIAPQVTFEVGDSVLSNVLVQSFLHDRLHQIETHVMRNSEHLADKIFLDRRSSRTIQNGDEIRSLLESCGYKTLYAEDLSLEQQMRCVTSATDIVAIHGEALCPLGYRTSSDPNFNLTEIFSPGHVVQFFNHFCEGLPCRHMEVRGALTKDMVPGVYSVVSNDMTFATNHALDAFYVDPESLTVALSPTRVQELLAGLNDTWQLSENIGN